MTDNIIKTVIFAIVLIILGLVVLGQVGFFGEKPWSPITSPGETENLDIPLGETGGTEILEVPPTIAVPQYDPLRIHWGTDFSDTSINVAPVVTPINVAPVATPVIIAPVATPIIIAPVVTPTGVVIEVPPTSAVPEYDSLVIVLILSGIIGIFVIGKRDIYR